MNVYKQIHRFYNLSKDKGLKEALQCTYSFFYDFYFDAKYNLDTCARVEVNKLDIEESKKEHITEYEASRILPLRKLFKKLDLPQESAFIDIGCGKGRVLLIASEVGYKNIIGIEISPKLCEIANKNIYSYKSKTQVTSNISIINADAAKYQYKDDKNVFFLFNPFDTLILEQVIQNIKASLKRKNRKIWMIYANALHRELIEKNMNIIKVSDFNILESEFVVFEAEILDTHWKKELII